MQSSISCETHLAVLCVSDDMLLQEDLMDMRPAVEEANSISEELDKKKQFEMMLVSPEARGELKGRSEVHFSYA